RFGKGELEGVVAPETAAHAAGVAAILPMITLGIPGSPTAAVMLGGLIIWGLQPGPLLFTEKPDFVWGLIASMYTGYIIGALVASAARPAADARRARRSLSRRWRSCSSRSSGSACSASAC